jgi:hypothetical protein
METTQTCSALILVSYHFSNTRFTYWYSESVMSCPYLFVRSSHHRIHLLPQLLSKSAEDLYHEPRCETPSNPNLVSRLKIATTLSKQRQSSTPCCPLHICNESGYIHSLIPHHPLLTSNQTDYTHLPIPRVLKLRLSSVV